MKLWAEGSSPGELWAEGSSPGEAMGLLEIQLLAIVGFAYTI